MSRWLDIARLRLRSLLRRQRVERELDKELRFHLDRQIEEYAAAGMPRDEARYAALRKLDGFTQIEEHCRDMRRTNWIENFLSDLHYALRSLGKSPGFAAVIFLTLALSIGANSAIFSVIHGVLLRRLPYPQENRIVRFFLSNPDYPKFPVNAFDFLDFRARNRSFGSMAIMTRADVQLSGMGLPQRLIGFRVSGGYFRVLGMRALRGREFDTSDELPGKQHIVILSESLWRSRFDADPHILGRKIILEGLPFTIVGVMPAEMQHPGNEYRPVAYGSTVDLWWPFTFEGNPSHRGSHYIEGIGRLKAGVSAERASDEMNAIMAQLGREHPDNDTGWRVLIVPLYREIVGASQRMLLVLLGAVGLVLLIACANVANLLLARATSRRREMAVRLALGASRARLIRQMLTESALIASLGGVAGAGVAIFGVRALVTLLPAGFPRAHEIHVNLAVFAFTLATALSTGMLFGLAPALQASRIDPQQNLREGARGASASAGHLRLRNWLVVSEVGLACTLLIGAGLMLRSFINLLHSDPGFRPEHVLTAAISPPEETYKSNAQVIGFYTKVVDSLSAIPSVKVAGLGSDVPWTGYDDNLGGFTIEGKLPPPNQDFHARYHSATPDYFRALGMPLLRGRFFARADDVKAPAVLIINRAMAERYWPGEDVLGKRINFFDSPPKDNQWATIVGLVGDVKDTPEKLVAEPAFWWPLLQTPFGFPQMMITIRAVSDPAPLVAAVRDAVQRLDPSIAVADVRLMDSIADASVSTPRFTLFLVALFASLAITLAAIGTYGVISYSVNQRIHEFGRRAALGAQPWDVMRLVLAQGFRLAGGGMVIGIAGALALGRVVRSLLYEVSATDPLTFVIVPLIALAVALLACYLPARRATRVDPAVALRTE
jgi:predicted permease